MSHCRVAPSQPSMKAFCDCIQLYSFLLTYTKSLRTGKGQFPLYPKSVLISGLCPLLKTLSFSSANQILLKNNSMLLFWCLLGFSPTDGLLPVSSTPQALYWILPVVLPFHICLHFWYLLSWQGLCHSFHCYSGQHGLIQVGARAGCLSKLSKVFQSSFWIKNHHKCGSI